MLKHRTVEGEISKELGGVLFDLFNTENTEQTFSNSVFVRSEKKWSVNCFISTADKIFLRQFFLYHSNFQSLQCSLASAFSTASIHILYLFSSLKNTLKPSAHLCFQRLLLIGQLLQRQRRPLWLLNSLQNISITFSVTLSGYIVYVIFSRAIILFQYSCNILICVHLKLF